jgi:hypothetical protein
MIMLKEKPQIEAEKPIKTIHESIFWDEDDIRWSSLSSSVKEQYATQEMSGGGHNIDMGTDSYIWCFVGSRGAGKTTTMTYFAMKANYLYDLPIISNYDIEYRLNRVDGRSYVVKSERLDLYKLLCFDADYNNCLIVIDEAPDVISHMAAMTWKNRLLNIFVRQIRKNHNSLYLGAQQIEIIDKSFRWQVDIIAECQDASRKYGWGAAVRGECVLCRLLDNTGMWTGETWMEAERKSMRSGHYSDPGELLEVYPRVLWEHDGKKPVFDSYYQQDIWESLRKVDMKLLTYDVGKNELDDSDYLERTVAVIDEIKADKGNIFQTELWASLNLTSKEKNDVSKRLSPAGVTTVRERHGKRRAECYDFTDFDRNKFLRGKK